MAKIKVICIKPSKTISIFYDDEHHEIKQGHIYYVNEDHYEDFLTAVFVYEWDDVVNKFWELGLFYKNSLQTIQELRNYKINKILENG